MSPYIRSIASLIFMLSSGPHCTAASFDCTKATSAVETKICADAELSELDSELGRLYATNRRTKASLVSGQKRWLNETRNKCESIDCLKNAYALRISEISRYDTCPVAEKAIEGSWVRERNGFFEEMAFSSASGEKDFFSWIHHRPEMSGTWEYRDCMILIDGGTSRTTFEFRPTKLENNRLYLIDEDKQHAIYRRLK